jgi:hypothetical protein
MLKELKNCARVTKNNLTSNQLFLNIALTRIQLGVQEQYSLHNLQKQIYFSTEELNFCHLKNILNKNKDEEYRTKLRCTFQGGAGL